MPPRVAPTLDPQARTNPDPSIPTLNLYGPFLTLNPPRLCVFLGAR